MRNFKKLFKVVVLSLTLALIVPTISPISVSTVAQAAAVKLNLTKKTLEPGKSVTLKVSGAKKSVLWSSSKKSVATVSKTGKVNAKAIGTATITAKADGTTLTCKITVKAPFDVKKASLGDFTFSVPKSWNFSETKIGTIPALLIMPKASSESQGASIVVTCTANGISKQSNFDLIKKSLEMQITDEYIKALLKSQLGMDVDISNFKMVTQNIALGKAVVISYQVKVGSELAMTQTLYEVFTDGYTIEVTITENGSKVKPSMQAAGKYLVNTIKH